MNKKEKHTILKHGEELDFKHTFINEIESQVQKLERVINDDPVEIARVSFAYANGYII